MNKQHRNADTDAELLYRSKRDGSLHLTPEAVRVHHSKLDTPPLASPGKSPAPIGSYEQKQTVKKLNSALSGRSRDEMLRKIASMRKAQL